MDNKKIPTGVGTMIIIIIAVTVGAFLWLYEKNQPSYLQPIVETSHRPIAKNNQFLSTLPSQTPSTASNDEVDQISTRDAYNKSVELLKDKPNLELYNIGVDRFNTGVSANTMDLFFRSNSKIYGTLYHLDTKIAVQMPGNSDPKMQKTNNIDPAIFTKIFPTIPDNIIDIGFEGALKILQSDQDYIKYKANNPDVFLKYVADLEYTAQDGWEWHISYNPDEGNTISFAINPETNKVVIENMVPSDSNHDDTLSRALFFCDVIARRDFYNTQHRLPETTEEIVNYAVASQGNRDPDLIKFFFDHGEMTYKKTGETTYTLCGNFNSQGRNGTESQSDNSNDESSFYYHPKGLICFQETINQ